MQTKRFLTLILIAAILTACGGGGGGSSPSVNPDVTPDPTDDVEPLDYSPANPITDNPIVINAVRNTGFPMYSGTNPPNIEGDYMGPCYTTTDKDHGSSIKVYDAKVELSGQTADGRIDFTDTQPETDNMSTGNYYISGENDSFTVVAETVHYFGDCAVTQAVLYSGVPEDWESYVYLDIQVLTVTLSKENCEGYSIPSSYNGHGSLTHEKPLPDPDPDTTDPPSF